MPYLCLVALRSITGPEVSTVPQLSAAPADITTHVSRQTYPHIAEGNSRPGHQGIYPAIIQRHGFVLPFQDRSGIRRSE